MFAVFANNETGSMCLQMISVERVLDYSRLPSEAPLESSDDRRPPPAWPHHGQIAADGASLKYDPQAPTVLKNISFTVQAQEKVGTVALCPNNK